MEVDKPLSGFVLKRTIFLRDHTKMFHPRNPSKSKLHLNKSGTSIVRSTFARAISNILNWHEMEGNDQVNCKVEECKPIYQNGLFNNELNSMQTGAQNKKTYFRS